MRRISLLLLVSGLLAVPGRAQLGGLRTYAFLNLPASARISALGGNLITVRDDDVSLAFANPSLLNERMHQQLSFNHSFQPGDIQHGLFTYGHHAAGLNTTFQGGVQYVRYGEFTQTDELGQQLGTFKAAEYALTAGAGRWVDERLAVGANLKLISSQFEAYRSLGLAVDLAAIYLDTANQFTATLVVRNAGRQLTTYRADNPEPLPFEIQLGISKRLRYLPFRFSVIYHNMQRWNIIYDDPNAEEPTLFFGDVQAEQSDLSLFFDNLFRHLIFNGELLLGAKENFRLRVGYNHWLRKELSTDGFGSGAGFSFGVGFKVNRFRLDYGRYTFHQAGGLNHFSISTNLREFRR